MYISKNYLRVITNKVMYDLKYLTLLLSSNVNANLVCSCTANYVSYKTLLHWFFYILPKRPCLQD